MDVLHTILQTGSLDGHVGAFPRRSLNVIRAEFERCHSYHYYHEGGHGADFMLSSVENRLHIQIEADKTIAASLTPFQETAEGSSNDGFPTKSFLVD